MFDRKRFAKRLIPFTTIYVILVIWSDLFYSIGASRAARIITPSDPTRDTDHLDHDPYYQVIVNQITLMLKNDGYKNHT